MTEQPHTGYTIVTEYRIHDEEWCALIYKGTGPDAVDLANYQASKYGKTEDVALMCARQWLRDEKAPKPLGGIYRTNEAGNLDISLDPDPAAAA